MTIRELFATIHGTTDLAWQSFLDLDIVWTIENIGLFAIPIIFILWMFSRRPLPPRQDWGDDND